MIWADFPREQHGGKEGKRLPGHMGIHLVEFAWVNPMHGGVAGAHINKTQARRVERNKFMENIQQSEPTEQPAGSRMSLGARLTNVFVAPGEVFAEVKSSPPTPANWVAPMVLAMIAGIVYVMVVFSQPAVIQGMKDAREKQLQEQVASGKMTQKQADTATESMEKFMTPSIVKAFGIAGSILATGAGLFFSALVVWLIGRFGLRGQFDYMRAVEVVGLSMMISVLGAIIAMLLAVIYGNPAMTPSPVLLLSHFDNHNRVHVLLSSLNVTTLWYLAVLSVGLAKVSGRGFALAAAWLYGLWAFFTLGSIWLFVGRWG
jgi:Yip1 domain